MIDTIPLAMTVYSPWEAHLFSQDGLEDLLFFGMLVATLAVPLLARRQPSSSSYFSAPFVLALCPFLFAAVIALLRIHSLLEHEDTSDPGYVVERLRHPWQMLLFGGGLSGFTVINYSIIRAAVRRRGRVSAEPSPCDERSA